MSKDVRRGISLYIDGKEVKGSVIEIKAEMRKLVKEQESMTKGSKEYVEHGKKIRQLKGVLSEHNQQLNIINKTQKSMLSSGVDLFNKYAASAMAIVAALTGVVLKLNQMRKLAMDREESKADLMALTGLGDDDITWLEQKAIELSTTVTAEGVRIRQSASDILEAYKLVGSAKPELLANREALAEVTRETLILASASGMKLTDAVDAATLSMNQYSAASDQASRYVNVLAAGSKVGAAAVESITKAVQKSGVSAASAGVPIEQLVGTIETIAEKGIKNEEAGTQLKNFFLTLQTGADETNPKIVGLDKALENLNKKQMDATEIRKMFGKETFNVASILINDAEKVKFYTEAVTDTNIAYEQAAIKSDTLAAKLDHVKNAMNEQGIELMKELNPAITRTLSSLVSWSRHTVTVVKFISEHRSTLLMLITAIIAYNTWINRKIIVDKLAVFWTEKMIVANKSLIASLKANPWMLAISALTVVIGLLVDLQRKQNQITQSMRSLESINKKTTEEYDKQAAKVELLTMIINDNNVSLQKRLEKLAELKEIVPGYNAQLTEEGKLINNNTTAIKDYLKAFEQKIRLQAAEEELTQLIKDKIVAENALKEAEKKRQEVQNRSGSKVRGRGLAAERRTKADLEEAKKNLDQLENAILDVNKLRVSLIAEETVVPNAGGGGGGDDPLEDEDRIKKDMERLEAEHLSKMLALKERYLSDSSMSEDEYNQEIERLALELLLSKMDISGLELNDQQKLLDAIFNMKIKARDKILSMERKKSEQERKDMEQAHKEKISLLDRQQKEEVMQLTEKRIAENMTEDEYNRQLKDLMLSFINEKLALDNLSEDERLQLEKEKQDMRLQNYIENEEKIRQKNLEYRDFLEDMAESMGATLGEMFAGNEEGMRNMLKNMLGMILDYLEKVVIASIGQVTITGATNFASAALAMGKILAIKAAFSAVKSAIGNFYTGGFTGAGAWDDPKGIVHSNEFVANRFAVANPAVRPVLDLLDHAQRSGSISNLSSADIAAVSGGAYSLPSAAGGRSSANTVSPSAGVDNKILQECIQVMRQVKERFEGDIVAEVAITGKRGIKKVTGDYDKLIKNVRR